MITLISASKDLDVIQASLALAKCGISLLKAKRAAEQVAATGAEVPLLLPKISDLNELFVELGQAGINADATMPQKEVAEESGCQAAPEWPKEPEAAYLGC